MERTRKILRLLGYTMAMLAFLPVVFVLAMKVVDPPFTLQEVRERFRHGKVFQDWVPIGEVPQGMQRAIVAAEDADFCRHWGLDRKSIETSLSSGSQSRGATITQKVARSLFLWPAESGLRRMMEVPLTLVIEAAWTKRRILEVYVNTAQFDRRVFGVAEASRNYLEKELPELTELEWAKMAAVLSQPVELSARTPSDATLARARKIVEGAQTIAKDGRDECFAAGS
ncbi:MAG: transglycosylase domain-containing protein [Rhodobacteraceae bacterium]|nr:transglycosylase domain-containing protein [Paracoccaceae bacterium]